MYAATKTVTSFSAFPLRSLIVVITAFVLVLLLISVSGQDLSISLACDLFCIKGKNLSDQADVRAYKRNRFYFSFSHDPVSPVKPSIIQAQNSTFNSSINKTNDVQYSHNILKSQSVTSSSTPPPSTSESKGIASTQPPQPVHCSGLQSLKGRSGTITTGTGPAPDPNDCRWIITAANATQLTLTFTNFNVNGIFSRVWVFVGADDVARWQSDDVIETGRAYASFTGDVDPPPVVCHSGTALIIFETEASDAPHAGFRMSWTSSP